MRTAFRILCGLVLCGAAIGLCFLDDESKERHWNTATTFYESFCSHAKEKSELQSVNRFLERSWQRARNGLTPGEGVEAAASTQTSSELQLAEASADDAAPDPFADAFVERAKKSVVHFKLVSVDSEKVSIDIKPKASGYFIGVSAEDSNKLVILTCFHCVDDCIEFNAANGSSDRKKRKRWAYFMAHHYPFGNADQLECDAIECIDKKRDLALVLASRKRAKTAPPALQISPPEFTPTVGSDVLVVGFPDGTLTAHRSSVLKEELLTYGLLNTSGLTLASAPKLSGGISGSPLLSTDGFVVGTWWGRQTKANRGLCMSLKTIHEFLDENGYGYLYRTGYRIAQN